MRRRFKFFPSIAELDEFFRAFKLEDFVHAERCLEFEPPFSLMDEFERLAKEIGAAAYRTWFKGLKAYIKRDGELVLDCPTPLRARWIREHYAPKLAEIAHRLVIVLGDAPMSVGTPTHEAWWQTHDTRTGAVIAERRASAAERVEVQRRLDAGEPVASMMAPIAGVQVAAEDHAQKASVRGFKGGYVREEWEFDVD